MATSGAEQIYDRLVQHLQDLNSGTATVDARLFDEATLVLPEALRGNEQSQLQRVSLIQLSITFLSNGPSEPVPAINLLIKLFDGFNWTQIYELTTNQPIPFRAGLFPSAEAAPFNRLIIALLDKAAQNRVDAAHLACLLDPDPVLRCLVECWLQTPDVGVAAAAQKLLLDLLTIDRESPSPDGSIEPPSGGQGLVWKRIFGDRDVYSAFFNSCALKSSLDLGKTQRTLAQARLLEWLPPVCDLDWEMVARSHHTEIEEAFGVKKGLLDFAALNMVDYRDDVLLHRCLVDFYTALLRTTRPSDEQPFIEETSISLHYLISCGLHVRTAAIYLQLPGAQLDPVDSMFLYGPAANYIATYANTYPEHFSKSDMPKQVLERVRTALSSSQRESPQHDLHVLASIPRKTLLTNESIDILTLLSSKTRNPDILNTLATIFRGPEQKIIQYPPSSTVSHSTEERDIEEATCARALYYKYMTANPQLWADVVTHADTVALKEVALAALNCLLSVITANWTNKSEPYPIPASLNPVEEGFLAAIAPPAGQSVIPYILSPPRTFSNLLGGRDVESAAYQIAMAKFDCQRALYSRLTALGEDQRNSEIVSIVGQLGDRLAQGPMSREGEVGGRIGTLGM